MAEEEEHQQHILVVSYSVQGHINPAVRLAKRIARAGARTTFSTTIAAHRRMFPNQATFPFDDPHHPLLSYFPFSDGYDDGFSMRTDDTGEYLKNSTVVACQSLRSVATATARPPVTRIITALFVPFAVEVARGLNIPAIPFWIQPATVFSVYHHYFGSRDEIIDLDDPNFVLELPNLPRLGVNDIPSFMVKTNEFPFALPYLRKGFEIHSAGADGTRPKILVNSFEELERDALQAVSTVELVPIGPVLPLTCFSERTVDLESEVGNSTDESGCMEWLEKWPEGSVVYISFGSIANVKKKQRMELAYALIECGRPFLWIDAEKEKMIDNAKKGKVVEWCSQVEVLSHVAVGCFVTHNGWNSTIESLTCGVPMVCIPQWAEQWTNACLVEKEWGVGVRAKMDDEGVVMGSEIVRCIEVVMGQGEEAKEIRGKAKMWKERARRAMIGGSSERNFEAFVRGEGIEGSR